MSDIKYIVATYYDRKGYNLVDFNKDELDKALVQYFGSVGFVGSSDVRMLVVKEELTHEELLVMKKIEEL